MISIAVTETVAHTLAVSVTLSSLVVLHLTSRGSRY